jgi:hypothetical protein
MQVQAAIAESRALVRPMGRIFAGLINSPMNEIVLASTYRS